MKRLLCWDKIKGDGNTFEAIIEELLHAMFPQEEYVHTQQTRDGGKDFVCITKNAESYWAECKNYTDALATSDIAKTFVMAIAEDVKKVMIFSISPLTDIAIQEISRFTEKIQYEIKLYDGDSLNALMACYIDKVNLSDDFKRDFQISYLAQDMCTVFSIVSRNDYLDELSIKQFYIGDLITYQIYFKNNSQNSLKIECMFDAVEIPGELLLIGSETDFPKNTLELEPGSYAQYSYKFRVATYKDKIRLFDLRYSINGSSKTLKGVCLTCDWIAEVPLLGKSREILQEFKEHNLGNKELSLVNIYGHSGVGKSRLIREMRNAFQDRSYKTLFLPVHSTRENGKILIRKLVSMIKGLPYLPGENIKVNSKDLIYQILYNDDYDIENNFDKISALIHRTYVGEKPIVIIVDNLQFGDSLLIKTVKSILNSISYNAIIIAGFNQDYLYNDTAADKLFYFVRNLAGNSPNQNIELVDFDDNTAEQYIFNCLDRSLLWDNRFKNTVRLFIQNSGKNPLILHQTVLYLAQKQILRKTGSSFHVADIEAFHQAILHLSPQFGELLNHRHELVKEHFSEEAYKFYLIFMKILSVFRKITPKVYRQMFSVEHDNSLNELISLGFLQYGDEGEILFYHHKLELFYYYLSIGESILHNILNVIDVLSDAYFHEKYIIKEKACKLSECDFAQALQHLDDVDYSNQYRYITAVYKTTCDFRDFSIECQDFLTVTEYYFRITQRHMGIRYQIEGYEQTVKSLLRKVNEYRNFAELLWRISLTCVNALIQLHKNNQALQLLELFEPCITTFQCSDKTIKNIQASLYNRFGVIYNTFNNQTFAERYLKKSLKLGLEIKDKYKVIEAYSDYGSFYYDQPGKLRKTYRYWNKLFHYFMKTNPTQYEYLMPKCYYHKIYVFLLRHKYGKAEKLLQEYKELYWNQTVGHYKIKMMYMDIALKMLKPGDPSAADNEEIIFLLNQVEDECIYNGTVREYYKVFYLRALFYLFYKKADKAYENLIIAFEQIVKFCDGNDYLIQRHLPALLELRNHIMNYEKEHMELGGCFTQECAFKKASSQIQHVQENDKLHYVLPLMDREKRIVFPKL